MGRLVAIDVSGRRVRGVLLFASQSECDVLTEEGTVRRARADRVEAYGGPIADETRRIANDAQVFGTLSEGERVRFESREGVMIEGALVEKCRYGGLVLTGEGKLVAVGFRKLWPVSKDSVS